MSDSSVTVCTCDDLVNNGDHYCPIHGTFAKPAPAGQPHQPEEEWRPCLQVVNETCKTPQICNDRGCQLAVAASPAEGPRWNEILLKFREYRKWMDEQITWLATKWSNGNDCKKECAKELLELLQPAAQPSPDAESSIERQIAICEQNGAKWCNFAVADVKRLMVRPSAKVEEIAVKCVEFVAKKFSEWMDEEGPSLPVLDIRKEDFASILRRYFTTDAPPQSATQELARVMHFWYGISDGSEADELKWVWENSSTIKAKWIPRAEKFLAELAAPSNPSPAPGNPYGDNRMLCAECKEPVCDHVAEKLMPSLISYRQPTEQEIQRGMDLIGDAREALERNKKGAGLAGEATEGPGTNRYWDIFTADDGGRLLRLCWRKNDAGHFMAMEVAEMVTWNNAAEQKEAEDFALKVLNAAEKNREWIIKRADGEDRTFLTPSPAPAAPEGAAPPELKLTKDNIEFLRELEREGQHRKWTTMESVHVHQGLDNLLTDNEVLQRAVAEVRELRASVEFLERELNNFRRNSQHSAELLEQTQAQLRTAREALRKYAVHFTSCAALKGNPTDMRWPDHPRCDCGLRKAVLSSTNTQSSGNGK